MSDKLTTQDCAMQPLAVGMGSGQWHRPDRCGAADVAT